MASLYQESFWKKLLGRRMVNGIPDSATAISMGTLAPKWAGELALSAPWTDM